MSGWIAHYEEGYITAAGETVTVSDTYHPAHDWRNPQDAMRHWKDRPDLRGTDVHEYGNGLEQVDDVHRRREFAQLGIRQIWRRVTFTAD